MLLAKVTSQEQRWVLIVIVVNCQIQCTLLPARGTVDESWSKEREKVEGRKEGREGGKKDKKIDL